jgi:hypothetical protein
MASSPSIPRPSTTSSREAQGSSSPPSPSSPSSCPAPAVAELQLAAELQPVSAAGSIVAAHARLQPRGSSTDGQIRRRRGRASGRSGGIRVPCCSGGAAAASAAGLEQWQRLAREEAGEQVEGKYGMEGGSRLEPRKRGSTSRVEAATGSSAGFSCGAVGKTPVW